MRPKHVQRKGKDGVALCRILEIYLWRSPACGAAVLGVTGASDLLLKMLINLNSIGEFVGVDAHTDGVVLLLGAVAHVRCHAIHTANAIGGAGDALSLLLCDRIEREIRVVIATLGVTLT